MLLTELALQLAGLVLRMHVALGIPWLQISCLPEGGLLEQEATIAHEQQLLHKDDGFSVRWIGDRMAAPMT